jgi:hypothetical protein
LLDYKHWVANVRDLNMLTKCRSKSAIREEDL